MARTELTGKQIKNSSVELTEDVTGVLPVANGGSGSDTLPINNVLLGNGTGALQAVAPGATGNVLTSDGSAWTSSSALTDLSNDFSTFQTFVLESPAKQPTSEKAQPNGYASLDSSALVPVSQMNLTDLTLVRPKADNVTIGFSQTLKSAGTTTLTASSNQFQLFTGTQTHTVVLGNTLKSGNNFYISNRSTTATLTIDCAGGNLTTLPGLSEVRVTCLADSPTSAGQFYVSPYWKVITKTDLGLGAVDNTSDATKNAATATLQNKTLSSPQILSGTVSEATLTNCTLTTPRIDALAVLADTYVTNGSTTSIFTSNYGTQIFTGTQTQTAELDGTNMLEGATYTIVNQSTQSISVTVSNGTTSASLVTVPTLSEVRVQALSATPTAASDWYVSPVVRQTLSKSDVGLDQVSNVAADTAATASTVAQRDSSANLVADNFIPGFASTATAAGTTTLTVDSAQVQLFTGSTTQTVVLPTTGIVAGHQFTIINNSTGTVTVQSSGGNTVAVLPTGASVVFTALVATPTTAANWKFGHMMTASSSANVSGATIASRDGNGNLSADSFISGFTTTATAAGTTTLTADSRQIQEFTGSLTQTVVLPQASTPAGTQYTIINNSSGSVTVQASDFSPVAVVSNGGQVVFTALVSNPNAASLWKFSYLSQFIPSQVTNPSTLVLRDSSGNIRADNHIPGFTTQAAISGTTVLSVDSAAVQEFTGTTTGQVITMPGTVVAGTQYTIINNSSGSLTVQSSGGNTIVTVQPGSTSVTLTALVNSPTTNVNWQTTRPWASGNSPNALVVRDSSGNASFSGVNAATFTSTATTGIAPFTVASTTQVTNLNANYLGGYTPSAGAGASQIALRDGFGNLLADRFIGSKDSYATAGGSTTLSLQNSTTVEYTGSSNQTVLLPTTSVPGGHTQTIVNNSTGILTVQASGGSFLAYMNPGDLLVFYALIDTPTTNAHWRVMGPNGAQPVSTSTSGITVSMYHSGSLLLMNNSTAANVTIPTNASIAFPIGTSIDVIQQNVGQVTFVGAGGVTVNGYPGLRLAGQYCGASLRKIGTDTWVAVGALSA